MLDLNENVCTTYPNLWDTVIAVLSGVFIALNAPIKKFDNSYSSDLTVYTRALEQKEENSHGRNRWQEIIKLKAETNKIEREQYKESVKQRVGSLRK